jgi:hypothetical protein
MKKTQRSRVDAGWEHRGRRAHIDCCGSRANQDCWQPWRSINGRAYPTVYANPGRIYAGTDDDQGDGPAWARTTVGRKRGSE